MNIAFQALLVILFYLPGALFVAAFFGRLSKDQELPIITLSLTGRAAGALLIAAAFHALWGGIITVAGRLGAPIYSAAGAFFTLLSVHQQAPEFLVADRWEAAHLADQFGYFATVCIGAGLAGALLHRMIRHYKLDYKIPWLKFRPQWHYFLSGEYAEDPNSVVWIDAMTQVDEHAVVYSGLVKEYWFDETTGALDTIWLEWAERICIHVCPEQAVTDREQGTLDREQAIFGPVVPDPLPAEQLVTERPARRGEQIPGSRFALKMSEVKNINLVYLSPGDEVETDGIAVTAPSESPA